MIYREGSGAMWENNKPEGNAAHQCSFCGKKQDQVSQLTAGPGGVYVCNECVDLYREHIENMAGEAIATEKLMQVCSSCGTRPPASHRYCFNCGAQLGGKL